MTRLDSDTENDASMASRVGSLVGTIRRLWQGSMSTASETSAELRRMYHEQGSVRNLLYGTTGSSKNHYTTAFGSITLFSLLAFIVLVIALRFQPGIAELVLMGVFLFSLFIAVHCCIREVREYRIAPHQAKRKINRNFRNSFSLTTMVIEYMQLAAFGLDPNAVDVLSRVYLSSLLLDVDGEFFAPVFFAAFAIPILLGVLFLVALLLRWRALEEFLSQFPVLLFLPVFRLFLSGLTCTCTSGFNEEGECRGDYVLDSDSSIICWQGLHVVISMMSFFGVLLFYPVFTLFQLRFVPSQINYKPRFVYYQAQMKLILIGFTAYFTTVRTVYLGSAAVATFVLFWLQLIYRPCNVPEINYWRSVLSLMAFWVVGSAFAVEFLTLDWLDDFLGRKSTHLDLAVGGLVIIAVTLFLVYLLWNRGKDGAICPCVTAELDSVTQAHRDILDPRDPRLRRSLTQDTFRVPDMLAQVETGRSRSRSRSPTKQQKSSAAKAKTRAGDAQGSPQRDRSGTEDSAGRRALRRTGIGLSVPSAAAKPPPPLLNPYHEQPEYLTQPRQSRSLPVPGAPDQPQVAAAIAPLASVPSPPSSPALKKKSASGRIPPPSEARERVRRGGHRRSRSLPGRENLVVFDLSNLTAPSSPRKRPSDAERRRRSSSGGKRRAKNSAGSKGSPTRKASGSKHSRPGKGNGSASPTRKASGSKHSRPGKGNASASPTRKASGSKHSRPGKGNGSASPTRKASGSKHSAPGSPSRNPLRRRGTSPEKKPQRRPSRPEKRRPTADSARPDRRRSTVPDRERKKSSHHHKHHHHAKSDKPGAAVDPGDTKRAILESVLQPLEESRESLPEFDRDKIQHIDGSVSGGDATRPKTPLRYRVGDVYVTIEDAPPSSPPPSAPSPGPSGAGVAGDATEDPYAMERVFYEQQIAHLHSMGFTDELAIMEALRAAGGNLERATAALLGTSQ